MSENNENKENKNNDIEKNENIENKTQVFRGTGIRNMLCDATEVWFRWSGCGLRR